MVFENATSSSRQPRVLRGLDERVGVTPLPGRAGAVELSDFVRNNDFHSCSKVGFPPAFQRQQVVVEDAGIDVDAASLYLQPAGAFHRGLSARSRVAPALRRLVVKCEHSTSSVARGRPHLNNSLLALGDSEAVHHLRGKRAKLCQPGTVDVGEVESGHPRRRWVGIHSVVSRALAKPVGSEPHIPISVLHTPATSAAVRATSSGSGVRL